MDAQTVAALLGAAERLERVEHLLLTLPREAELRELIEAGRLFSARDLLAWLDEQGIASPGIERWRATYHKLMGQGDPT